MLRVLTTTAAGASVCVSAPAWLGAIAVVTAGAVIVSIVVSDND